LAVSQFLYFLIGPEVKIHPSAAAAARKRKLSSQNLTQAGRENAGPFLNMQIQILS
jgi:hypothetical protein